MSEGAIAPVSSFGPRWYCACTLCKQQIGGPESQHSRHLLPCAHVICGSCVVKLESDQKSGESRCPSAGCNALLEPVTGLVTAWCTNRSARLEKALSDSIADQGNVGDGSAPGLPNGSEDVKELTTSSSKEAIEALASHSDEDAIVFARVKRAVSIPPTLTAQSVCDGLAAWLATELARLREWEEREVAGIRQATVNVAAQLQKVADRRREVALCVLAQRLGLRTTLEEIEHELSEQSREPSPRAGRLLQLTSERHLLATQLAEGSIRIAEFGRKPPWSAPASLEGRFGKLGDPPLAGGLSSEGCRADPRRRAYR